MSTFKPPSLYIYFFSTNRCRPTNQFIFLACFSGQFYSLFCCSHLHPVKKLKILLFLNIEFWYLIYFLSGWLINKNPFLTWDEKMGIHDSWIMRVLAKVFKRKIKLNDFLTNSFVSHSIPSHFKSNATTNPYWNSVNLTQVFFQRIFLISQLCIGGIKIAS